MKRPRIAFFIGDPNGIGPELTAQVLSRDDVRAQADITLVCDPELLAEGERIAQHRVPRESISIDVLPGLDGGALTPGQANARAGQWVLAGLARAAALARSGAADAVVFAPLNKQAMKLGGLAHPDEQHLFAELLGADGYTVEFNVIDRLWTSRVTSHIPLREVAASITPQRIVDAARIIDAALRRSGNEAPRIAVAGLNPHAGEGGTMGHEEIDVIAPAIADARALGIDAHGPLPADTIFVRARGGEYDAVVTMYHDQGQIAMKLMGFDRGVTVMGGMPVPVATCAHGTAYDIVGRNVANPLPLTNAVSLATRMAARAVSA